jgi:RNA polymerase sigma-70 factor, ECF subfamily
VTPPIRSGSQPTTRRAGPCILGAVPSPAVETRIAQAIERGDRDAAAAEAIRGFGPEILGYLSRVLGSRDQASDAFSFFAEQLWHGMPGFAGRSSVRVWAYRVAWSAAVRLRSDAWFRRRERFPSSMASRVAGEVLSRPAAVRERESAELTRLRAALEPEEQSLLVLRVDRGLSWREVAEVMAEEGREMDEPALRKRFERVKAKLARLAQEEGLIE